MGNRPAIWRAPRVGQQDAGFADRYPDRQPATAALALTERLARGEGDVAADGLNFDLTALAPQPDVDRRYAGIREDNVGLRA
nr:hypothetical protein [Mesorhizobium sp.]